MLDTKESAMAFLNNNPVSDEQNLAMQVVNDSFQDLLMNIWDQIPAGPGKTVAVRKLKEAKMSLDSVIVNNGL